MLLLLTACTDTELVVHNAAPLVSITSPPEGALLDEGTPAVVTASINDDTTDPADLALSWQLEDGSSPDGTPTLDGTDLTLTLADPFPLGDHTFTLQVVDGKSESGSDAVSFTVVAGDAPAITWEAPADEVLLGELVQVQATITDADETDPTALTLAWSGTAAGVESGPAHPDSAGHVEFYLGTQTLGAWTVQLTATDPAGHYTASSTAFTVVDGDADADGHVDLAWGGDDCDDGDPAIHPGASELCNEVDDDCDGDTDENADDAPTWYADTDGDSFGDPGSTTTACDRPSGHVDDASDCDDDDDAVFPGAIEVCNLVDDDCDGDIDEADASDASTWYADADGDTYGGATTTIACTAPAGFVSGSGDCDDGVATVNPGASERCNDVDDDCDGAVDDSAIDPGTWYVDADADGYGSTIVTACDQPSGSVSTTGDCDDAIAVVHPGATEHCDGIDEDCDGSVDEDAVDPETWYTDADGDGFGDVPVTACEAPPDGVTLDGDCDDGDRSINPIATERCDAADTDEDCDGVADDADTDATGKTTRYPDGDADGYGAGTGTAWCDAPTGTSSVATDCDDVRGDIHPGATEVCDGADDDCDGSVDEGVLLTWYRDADADSYGGLSSTTACAAPAGHVANATDCDDTRTAINPAATEVCDASNTDEDCDTLADDLDPGVVGKSTWYRDADADSYGDPLTVTSACDAPAGWVDNGEDCDDTDAGHGLSCGPLIESLSTAEAKILGSGAEDALGYHVAAVGDVDGDGRADLLVGAPDAGDAGAYSGKAALFHGGLSGTVELSGAAALWVGEDSYDFAGSAIAGGGDASGDGEPDLAIAAGDADRGGTYSGAVYVVSASLGGSRSLSSATTVRYGDLAYESAGNAVAIVDLTGDGRDDLVVGVAHWKSGSIYPGCAYVIPGPVTGTGTVSSGAWRLSGEATEDGIGNYVDASGDLDGDGAADLLLGSYAISHGYTRNGGFYLVLGPVTASASLSTADGLRYGEGDYAFTGSSTTSAGDVDGDGLDDVLSGAAYDNEAGAYAGAAYLFLGAPTGTGALAAADAKLLGEVGAEYAGIAVAGAGDLDADGFADVLVDGYRDATAGTDAGAAYVVYGPMTGSMSLADADWKLLGEQPGDLAGNALTGIGDESGDGIPDLLIGAPAADPHGYYSGAAYIVLGP